VNAEQLQAYVAGHKPVVLGVAAAGVVGLALLKRKKGTPAGAGAAASSSTKQPAGTIPAAAVLPSQSFGSTYDSSAYDVCNALSGQLEQLRQTTGAGGITAAPAPVASTLFAPSHTGNYVSYDNGSVFEVEGDGSQFNLVADQWQPLQAAGATAVRTGLAENPNRATDGDYYGTTGNLRRQVAAAKS
jgi:hypothetical protein